MKLHSLHILLTYTCNYECDHCFVWGSPRQSGVLTLNQIEQILQQAAEVAGLSEIYFEGGEAFLYYPVLIAGLEMAAELGFSTGLVSNGYWATAVEDARVWLAPLVEAGLGQLEISCDELHGAQENFDYALEAADELGLPTTAIRLEIPRLRRPVDDEPGQPVRSGGVMFRGRAAEKLTAGLPGVPAAQFDRCPYENLIEPGRLHLDPLGNLHLCQGIVIGNLFQIPLVEILQQYRPEQLPVVSSLLAGGPAQLARDFDLYQEEGSFLDACHLCYTTRQALQSQFSKIIAPDQMYGLFDRPDPADRSLMGG